MIKFKKQYKTIIINLMKKKYKQIQKNKHNE